jgi:hypothetical protein
MAPKLQLGRLRTTAAAALPCSWSAGEAAMEEKYVWAIGSAVLGWIAAQLTAVWRWWAARRWLRRAVLDEIRQIYDELERIWATYARALQVHGCRGVYPGLPLPLSNTIYTHHFKDAALVFTRVQRESIQMIHGYVVALNDGARDLKNLVDEIRAKDARGERLSDADLDLYGRNLRGLMEMIGNLRWNVHHHLSNPLFPIMDYGTETHERYLKHVEEVRRQIDEIAQSSGGLRREDFDLVYDPRHFRK